ncbi:DUF2127 domain-containing protein [Microbacterium sp. F51-2R]|jgi:uncharacterized membrane protein|uniref:DUF2127 domain-containing protein n=1 Tax=Microbacterium sp. F51-2R TaxID=3445777 RepID=UPI003FA0940D
MQHDSARRPASATRERVLDLVFLLGVLFKGIDGAFELVAGVALLFLSPVQLQDVARSLTAHELAQDPHDLLANLLLAGAGSLDPASATFLALYLLLHGVVKLAIVAALLLGSRRIYPWAIGALTLFLVYQVYELVVAPSVFVLVLTLFDAVIIALTWREWRHGRTLRETMRTTVDWVFRRSAPRP